MKAENKFYGHFVIFYVVYSSHKQLQSPFFWIEELTWTEVTRRFSHFAMFGSCVKLFSC